MTEHEMREKALRDSPDGFYTCWVCKVEEDRLGWLMEHDPEAFVNELLKTPPMTDEETEKLLADASLVWQARSGTKRG